MKQQFKLDYQVNPIRLGPLDCVNGFISGFRFRAEGDITGDDVMGTNMDSSCQSGEILEGNGVNTWGDWSSW